MKRFIAEFDSKQEASMFYDSVEAMKKSCESMKMYQIYKKGDFEVVVIPSGDESYATVNLLALHLKIKDTASRVSY